MATFPSRYVAKTGDRGTVKLIAGLAKLGGAKVPTKITNSNGYALCRVLEDGSDKSSVDG